MIEHECDTCGGVFWYDPYIQYDVFACPDCGAPVESDEPEWFWVQEYLGLYAPDDPRTDWEDIIEIFYEDLILEGQIY